MTARVCSSLSAASHLRIYIDGILHLSFSLSDLAEIQSWKMTTRCPPLFVIERTYKSGAVQHSDYDNEYLWMNILAEINRAYGVVHD